MPLEKNWDVKLTTGTFFRPSGKNIHRFADSKPGDDWGVRPEANLDFRVSQDLSRQPVNPTVTPPSGPAAAPSVTLRTITFEFGSAQLRPESIETLRNLGNA